jgi:flagellar motor protein MotB
MITNQELASKCAVLLLLGLLSDCALHPSRNLLESDYKQLNRRLASEISLQQVHISQLHNAVEIAVNCERLFPSGGWEMPTDAEHTIARIIPVVAPLQQTRIIITSYTDSVSIGSDDLQRQKNLQLSFMRAQTIMQFLVSHGVNPILVTVQSLESSDMVSVQDVEDGHTPNCVQLTLVGSGK